MLFFKEANNSNDDKNMSKLISYFHFLLSVFQRAGNDLGNILPPELFYSSLLPNA